MRPGTLFRTFAICSALVACIGLAACSSDDDNGNSSSGQSGGDAGSVEEYCEVVRELFEVGQTIGPREPTDDEVDRMVDLLRDAQAAAPPQVRRDFSATFVGDADARESLAEYNQTECGVDMTSQGTATP